MDIHESIKVHDAFQFEIKFGYNWGPTRKTLYELETYLFVPNNLGINRYTYGKDDFYEDVQGYIRFRTPDILLQDLAKGAKSPIGRFRAGIRTLVAKPTKRHFDAYENQVKMICSMFKSAARDHVEFVACKEHAADIADLVAKYTKATSTITREYRALRSMLNVPVITAERFQPYMLGDEYLSLLIEWFAYQLLETLANKQIENMPTLKPRILSVIRKEHSYREQRKYPSIPKTNASNEKFVFRSSILKKYMGSVLFLNTRIRREGGLVEHIAFGLAAGIAVAAATWASLWVKSAYSRVSIPLFLVLVLSYVFKDRIKEVCRIYFGNLLRHWLFDHKLTILHTKERIGWCKESVTLLPDKNVADRIRRLRNRGHLTEIESDWLGEQAILYRKRIKLFSRSLDQIYADYPLTGINDIIRFNVLKFLNKMDNPLKTLYILSGKDYRSIQAKRTYHIALIIKYKYKGATTFKRFRIVLCRSGIERIDEIYKDEIAEG